MLRKLTVPAALLSLTLGCAPFQPASAGPVTPEQSSLIAATCTNVMGLKKGEFYFSECQDSLTHSMARKIEAEASVVADNTCRNRGLTVGSAAFAVCALDEQNGSSAGADGGSVQPVSLVSAANVLESGKSYYSVTPSVQWQRERYSCAQLGLMPNSGLFGTCVASLQGALFPDPN